MSWIENPLSLFESTEIYPTIKMNRDQRTNSVTRLVLLVFIVLYYLKYKYSTVFLLLSLLIILILYFINIKEYYSDIKMDAPINYKKPLVGQNTKAQQKMSLQPLVAPRSHDREVWSFPSYRHSAVNHNNSMYELSEEYVPVDQPEDYAEYDPRLKKYTEFAFDKVSDMCSGRNDPSQIAPSSASQAQPQQQSFQSASPALTTNINNVLNTPVRENFASQAYNPQFDNRSQFSSASVQPSQQPQQNPPQTSQLFPDGSMLLPKTTTSIYAPDEDMNRNRFKYMENIQPSSYTYSDVSYPINSNLGISYTPQTPPLVIDQVAMSDASYPLFHRIDPQLVRDGNIPAERLQELPRRTNWSAKYSGMEAAPGTVNFEDIYDPRFNGYGDPYRSYGDVNLGQIQYSYSDIDRYRYPNFVTRSKVDFINFQTPMDQELPEYTRNVGLDDIRKEVESQYTADSLYFREDIQERLMRKRNRELWQLRAMPLRKNANSNFTSNF